MEADTLKRFDRLIAILIQLQSKKIIKAQEMADRFQVSLRTIYRDLRTLENAGVPLYGEAGSGYSLVSGYRLPPVMFTKTEAESFLAAEKLMQGFTDQSLRENYASGMYKIKSVLRTTEKDWLTTLDTRINVYKNTAVGNQAIPNAMELLFESIGKNQQVKLLYQSAKTDTPTERFIEPVGVFYEYQNWYILGYCHLRKDYRQFRLDRIHAIAQTEHPFTKSHGTVADHRPKNTENREQKVVLLVDKTVAQHLRYNYHYFGFKAERVVGKDIEMTFMTKESDEGFARWFMMFADCATIVEPASLKERVKEILTKGLQLLQKT